MNFAWADNTTAAVWAGIDHPMFAPMIRLSDGSAASRSLAVAKAKAIKDPKRRCLYLELLGHGVSRHPLDGPVNFEHGIALVRPIATTIAKAMPALGCVVLDNEDLISAWTMTADQLAIAAQELGVPYPKDTASINAFNIACGVRWRAAVRTAIFDPFRKYLPNAELSSFGDVRANPVDGMTDSNGWAVSSEGLMGTEASPAVYGNKGLLAATQTPWSDLIFSQNMLRTCEQHVPGKLRPWITGQNIDYVGAMNGSAYWREHIIHTELISQLSVLIFDANQPELPAKLIAIVDDIFEQCGGSLPAELCETPHIEPEASFIVTALADDAAYPTKLLARVTAAPGTALPASVTLAGQTARVVADSECGGWAGTN